MPGYVHDELAKEVEVELCSDLFINSLVYVVVLVGGLTLPPLEVLVEFVHILQQQVEDLLYRIINNTDRTVSLRHFLVEG